jgi:hypothetical protein
LLIADGIILTPAQAKFARAFTPYQNTRGNSMTTHTPDNSRRRFIKLTAIGLATAPFANALLSGTAGAAEMVSETDPQATALGYKADATKAEKRTDATAMCSNCNFYSGKAGEASGPCALFQGKLVAANGWCTAWAKKPA